MSELVGWRFIRAPRRWSNEEFDARLEVTPEKIEFNGGIFNDDRQRMNVLRMLVENLGIDRVVQLGGLEDWEQAVAERAAKERRRP